MKDNPIYLHLTRNSRQLSSRMKWLLVAVIGVLGGSLAVGAVCYVEALGGTAAVAALLLVLGVGSVGFVVLVPLLVLLVATLFTAKSIPQESSTVLWLTNITARQIVDGYIQTVTYHLRMLQVIGVGLVPQIVVTLAYYLSRPREPFALYLLLGSIPAIVITGALVAMSMLLCRLAIAAGVWMGLHWHQQIAVVVVGILLFAWGLFILWGLLNMRSFNSEMIIVYAGIVALMTVAAAPLLSLFTRFVRWGAYRAMGRMRQRQ